MPPNINDMLPVDCLMEVLSPLDMRSLFIVGRVCRLWRHLSETKCRVVRRLSLANHKAFHENKLDFYGIDITADKFDLALVYGDGGDGGMVAPPVGSKFKRGIPIRGHFDRKLDTEDDGHHFGSLFPNLTELTVTNYDRSSTRILSSILSKMTQLRTLKIVGSFEWSILRVALDKLTKVRHLSIDVSLKKLAQLAVVGNLESFYCKFGSKEEESVEIMDSLVNQLVSDRVVRFGLFGYKVNQDYDRAPGWLPKVGSKLIRLTCTYGRGLQHVARLAPNLTFLDVLVDKSSDFTVVHHGQFGLFTKLIKFKYHSFYGHAFNWDTIRAPDLNHVIIGHATAKEVEVRGIFAYCTRDRSMEDKYRQLVSYFPNASKVSLRIPTEFFHRFKNEVLCTESSCANCSYLHAMMQNIPEPGPNDLDAIHQQVRLALVNGTIVQHTFILCSN